MRARAKPVLKRPWLHHVIIICYIVAPLVNILGVKLFVGAPFGVIFARLFEGYGVLATIWLITAPIVGVSLYFVQRFSWYVFLGHSAIILADFVYKWTAHPAFYLRTVPGVHNILLLAGNIALVAGVGYVIQKDFRAPYFQVLNRTWRERVRIPIYHPVTIDGTERIMSDLSDGGCFVTWDCPECAAGHRVALSFRSQSLNIECQGEIMRITRKGIGIRFIRLPLEKKRDIRRLIRNRYSLRHKVDIPCVSRFGDEETAARMLDVSPTGCYVQAQYAGLHAGSEGVLHVAIGEARPAVNLPGNVVWINQGDVGSRPAGFGFHFGRRQASFVKEAAERFGMGILVR
ncbi:MAG TPA: PilZ domain-containing protein [Spirochaetia bacterium]|nr:PilZ domain-containing protein [Spirochaetia bacterium]